MKKILYWYCIGTVLVLFNCGDELSNEERLCQTLDNCSNFELFVAYDECVRRASSETKECLECMASLTCAGIEEFVEARESNDMKRFCAVCQPCCIK